MNRKSYQNVTLTCLTQQDEISADFCPNGIISLAPDGFRFEESIRKGRSPRNPKLFDGNYLSMVRMQNGRYQLHLKTMSDDLDREKFAFGVYSEIINALKIME